MWAIAIYDLGLTDEQFKKLTLKLFDGLLKRKNHEDKKTDYYFARLTLYLCGDKNKSTDDFMLFKEKKEQSVEDMADMIQMLNIAFGGEDLREQHS